MMAENSAIEWTDHTFNPWVGCTKISPACDHCYAEGWAKRTGSPELWSGQRRRTSASNWNQPVRWNRQAAAEGRRYRVFCASLADVFDNQVPTEWRDYLFRLIAATPHLDWLLLTKRPQNIAKMLPADWGDGRHNVWLGTTVANQAEADRNIPVLLEVPCRIRFLSIEPMLGAVDIARYMWPVRGWWKGLYSSYREVKAAGAECGLARQKFVTADLRFIDWVIVGGESGPGARPMHPDWARGIRNQCQAAGVPFLFKQWGEWACVYDRDADDPDWRRCGTVANNTPKGQWHNLAGGAGFHGERVVRMDRIGKKAAGRLLDGVQHDGVPMAAAPAQTQVEKAGG